MSAQPTAPAAAPDLVNIEIDGTALKVPKNSMIIQAADKAGIAIPRFCYHNKLPIAANCRMCMVETEMGGKAVPKPQPACATPVAEGMKIFTQSQRALSAQRNVMEFLLINHPLDCPICDQGGECELQDLAVGYGRSVSRFVERKRVVPDEDIGPLIETEMTRCIQCTRCVRFVSEIAGTYELGGMGRGENLEIGTYIGKSIESELGGNIIDVCPVGALTDKVYRFKARAWEMIARESIAYHDALGSNLWLHTRRGEVLRCVPRDNEAINECWLSDRDRFSHQGLGAPDRATKPLLKQHGKWVEASWEEAVSFVASKLRSAPAEIGVLAHPGSTCEEGLLLAKLCAGLGIANLDYRVRQLDLSDDASPTAFARSVADVEKSNAFLIVGSDLRQELPLLNHRVRNAWKHGAKVFAINPIDFDFNYSLAGKIIAKPSDMLGAMLRLARVLSDEGGVAIPGQLSEAIAQAQADDSARAMISALRQGSASTIIFGDCAVAHPQASSLRALAKYIATATDSKFNEIPAGANAVGLSHVGVRPSANGLDANAQIQRPLKSYVLYGIEQELDFADAPGAAHALRSAECVIAFSAFASASLRDMAHVILPIGLLPEIDGTLINVDGMVQSVAAGSKLPGDARSGWRVLRAIGTALGLPNFDFVEIADVRTAMHVAIAAKPSERTASTSPKLASAGAGFERIATVPIYRSDAVLRRAPALQSHPLTGAPAVALHPEDALSLGLSHGAQAKVSGGAGDTTLAVIVSRAVPRGAAWIESSWSETSMLPPMGAALQITRATA